MGLTLTEKLVELHQRNTPDPKLMVLNTDLIMCHEVTTPVAALSILQNHGDKIFDPQKVVCVIDHVTPSKDTATAMQAQVLREFAKRHRTHFYEVGRNGVCHAILPEKHHVKPGMVIVGGDSHTCTYGAFAALSFGIGTTDLEAALLTGVTFQSVQKTMQIMLNSGTDGRLPDHVYAKDVILHIIGRLGVAGATGHVMEFAGNVVPNLSMEGRMTISNMSVEAGATSGLFGVDTNTAAWLSGYAPIDDGSGRYMGRYDYKMEGAHRLAPTDDQLQWNPDPDAVYDSTKLIDLSALEPQVTWGNKPDEVNSVTKMVGTKVDQVYIGSCTNGRIEDLRVAANFLKNRKVADSIRAIVVPATVDIQKQAIQEGLAEIFIEAGCSFTNPTCGACLGMSNGVLAPGEVAAATTNRNFDNRMGTGGTVHLMSPATAAATALYGKIVDPREVANG